MYKVIEPKLVAISCLGHGHGGGGCGGSGAGSSSTRWHADSPTTQLTGSDYRRKLPWISTSCASNMHVLLT